MLLYSDPFKDNPFGKLQGEMVQVWATLCFDEAKIYKSDTDDAYIVAGAFTKLENVVRSYKPELPIVYPAMAIWTIHDKDYQVKRKKKDAQGNNVKNSKGYDEYETVTYKASIHEKLLYQHITDNPSQWLDESKNLKGKITHLNNGSYEMQSGNTANYQLPDGSFDVTQIEPTGNLPEWTPPKPKSGGNSWGGSNKASLEDKLVFIRKELSTAIVSPTVRENLSATDTPISSLVFEVVQQYQDNDVFLGAYFDVLKGILS